MNQGSHSTKTDRLVNAYYRSRDNWQDGTTQFRNMIHSRLPRVARVLDVGAGAGRNYLHDIRTATRRLVGVDVSPEVLQNSHLDEAFHCDAAAMPFRDEEFDLAFSDCVFEHLPDPDNVIRELYRVLRPGASFVLRTPNKWHYVPLAASVVSHSFQTRLLDRFTVRRAEDVFPKIYRCNTETRIRKAFEKCGFSVEELVLIEKEPVYLERSPFLFRLGVLYQRLVNSTDRLKPLRSNILAAVRKSGTPNQNGELRENRH